MPSRPVPLFWRLFIPNATVLGVMVAVNLVLMHRAVTPLTRLEAV